MAWLGLILSGTPPLVLGGGVSRRRSIEAGLARRILPWAQEKKGGPIGSALFRPNNDESPG